MKIRDMTIRKHPKGIYLPKWRDAVAKGRARKRAARSKRDILAIKTALATLKLRYCQEVAFWNELYKPETKKGRLDAGHQWVDFAVRPKGKPVFVIILDDPSKRWKHHEKEAYKVKQEGLNLRSVPFLVLPKGMASQEYQLKISWFMRKLT
jgi:hypothetical protein